MLVRFLAVVCAAPWMAPAQPPAIAQNGVVNAASQLSSTLPGAAIARGARFEIVGVRLAKSGAARVTIEHNGSSILAPVRWSEPARIEALMPRNAALGKNTLTVETPSGRSKPFPIEVAATRVGLYSRNRKGWGQGSIDLLVGRARIPNSISAPARPGQLVAISSTGLGDARGASIVVGGKVAAAVRIRPDPGSGLDEIRFRIPQDAPEGCYVPVHIRIPGDPPSNFVTVAIALHSSSCGMPGGGAVPPMEEQHLGAIGIDRAVLLYADDRPRTTVDEAYGAFLDSASAGRESSPLLSAPPEGTCTAYGGSNESGMPSFRSFPDALLGMLEGRGMSAGHALSLSDGRRTRTIPASGRGAYWVRLGLEEKGLPASHDLFFEGPAYSLSSSGGLDVSEFSRRLSSVSAFDWHNERDAAAIDRDRGLTVEWGSVSGANLMLILALSTDPLTTASAISLCSARPDAGRMQVPKDVFSYFPKTREIPGPPSSMFFVVAVRLETAMPPAVHGLERFWMISSFTRGRRVVYR